MSFVNATPNTAAAMVIETIRPECVVAKPGHQDRGQDGGR